MKNFLLKFWPILFIFILVFIFAFPYWAKGRIPFPADYLVNDFPPWQYFYGLPVKNSAMPDVIGQMFPWKHLLIAFWKKGQIPLWNPYNFSGNPLLANYQSAVFHPANWLFFILPEIEAWSLMILFQPFLAGLFTYLFCRQLKLSQAAALISSVAFMFCGFITTWMAYGTLAWALLWLPLILYALERSFLKLSSLSLSLISFSLMVSLFSGHFQISLYVVLASFSYLVFKLIVTRNWKTFWLVFVSFILGVLLASIQIFPTLELYRLSIRSQAQGISEIIPWQYLVTLLAPDFYGNPVTRNDWFGHYAEWSGFAGVIPLILALLVIFRKRRPEVLYFALLGLFSLVLRHPTFLLDLVLKWKIPVLSSSSAARINGLLSFSMAILAGFGLDQLKIDLKKREFKSLFGSGLFFLFMVLGIWGILLVKKPFEPEWLLVAKRNFILPTGMVAASGSLVLLYWLVAKFFTSFPPPPRRASAHLGGVLRLFSKYGLYKFVIHNSKFIILSAIILLTAFDLFRFAYKWMPFDSREHVYPNLPILEFLGKTLESDRLFGFVGMEMMNYYQIQGFNGYDPLFIQRYGELLMAANDGRIALPSGRGVELLRRAAYTERVMNLLGGRYYLHAIPDDRHVWEFNFWDYPGQFELVYQDDQYEVYENKDALPRAFLVNEFEVIQEDQAIIDRLLSEDFDLSKTVILEEEPDLAVQLSNHEAMKDNKVEVVKYTANKVELRIESAASALLFLSDNYYPGWKALVDGKETNIYRANYSFRAVVVPQGQYQVIFKYQPLSFRYGLIISVFSLLGVVLLVVRFRSFGITRHSERSEESPS